MNIKEAIEILGGYVYEEKPCPVGLFDEATRLGIEALKHINHNRRVDNHPDQAKLLGETNE